MMLLGARVERSTLGNFRLESTEHSPPIEIEKDAPSHSYVSSTVVVLGQTFVRLIDLQGKIDRLRASRNVLHDLFDFAAVERPSKSA